MWVLSTSQSSGYKCESVAVYFKRTPQCGLLVCSMVLTPIGPSLVELISVLILHCCGMHLEVTLVIQSKVLWIQCICLVSNSYLSCTLLLMLMLWITLIDQHSFVLQCGGIEDRLLAYRSRNHKFLVGKHVMNCFSVVRVFTPHNNISGECSLAYFCLISCF